jgi:hypothetical protein
MDITSILNSVKAEIADIMYNVLERFHYRDQDNTLSNQSNLDSEILTFDQTVEFFGISKPTLYSWTRKGLLPVVTIEGRRFIRKCDIDFLVNNSVTKRQKSKIKPINKSKIKAA